MPTRWGIDRPAPPEKRTSARLWAATGHPVARFGALAESPRQRQEWPRTERVLSPSDSIIGGMAPQAAQDAFAGRRAAHVTPAPLDPLWGHPAAAVPGLAGRSAPTTPTRLAGGNGGGAEPVDNRSPSWGWTSLRAGVALGVGIAPGAGGVLGNFCLEPVSPRATR